MSSIPVPNVTCAGCGISYHVNPSRLSEARYCSRACRTIGTSRDIADRFWSKVNKNGPIPTHCPELGPCAEWTAGRFEKGYGAFYHQGKLRKAHRVAWELTEGSIPDGLNVLHLCDNPKCQRHLFLGTIQDNSDDMVRKGRSAVGDRSGTRKYPERLVRGEKQHCAKLNSMKVVNIRIRYAAGTALQQELADEYGVSNVAISKIILRKTWKEV